MDSSRTWLKSLARSRVAWLVVTLVLVAGLGAGTVVALPRFAHAATSTISTCDEATLTAAVSGAASGDVLQFACSGTITLTSTLTIDKDLTLDGTGHSVTLDGNHKVQILLVSGTATVTLKWLTFSNGNGGSFAGGVENANQLTVDHCTFTGNTGENGGGFVNDEAATATITNSTFSGNTATFGGGAYNAQAGTLTLAQDTFSGNSAVYTGGGYENDGTTTVSGTLFTGNTSGTSAPAVGVGAGMQNVGTATITDSTFLDNSAENGGLGGGLENETNSTVTITGSTFSGNSASVGGAFYDFGAVSFLNSTITGNTAVSNGGGIARTNLATAGTITNTTIAGNTLTTSYPFFIQAANLLSESPVTVANSIIANPSGGSDCAGSGPFTDAGHNLDSDRSCGFATANHDLPGTDPKLGTLADNGGATKTLALLTGSPAIDAGGAAANDCPATDQRGVSRPQGTACDMGAYEFVPTTKTTLSATPTSIVVGQSVQLCATVGAVNNPSTPTGSVSFTMGAQSLGSATLSGGTACLSTTALPLGTDSITATYAGAGGFSGSVSAPRQVVVGVSGQDVMGGPSGGATGAPPSGNTNNPGNAWQSNNGNAGQQNPPAAPAKPTSGQQGLTSAFSLWTGIGLLLLLLGVCGLGVVLVRARGAASRASR